MPPADVPPVAFFLATEDRDFDINVRWKRSGTCPRADGEEGCVRELVQLANDHGFYWGGHFNRQDGMHFEIAQVQ